jgi:ankyrin repeat protein
VDVSQFLRAAMRGDVDAVRSALDAGMDADAQSAKGMTALMCSAWQGDHVEVARLLLDRGADLTVRQEFSGWTALTFAAVNGKQQCLDLFFERGATLDEPAGDWKALMFAVQYRSRATARTMLEHGADPNARDDDERTPLMRAARNSDAELVPVLLAAGAEVDLVDTNGMSALHHACTKANVPNVHALLEAGAGRALEDAAGRTPRAVAEELGKKKIVAALDA